MWEGLCCGIKLEDVGRKKSPAHIWILRWGESGEFPKAGGFFEKAGTIQDARKHKTGGGVGGGRLTRVWRVSCQLTWRKLSVQPDKTCVSINFQPKHPGKTTQALHIQAWIRARQKCYSNWGCASTDGVKEMKLISQRRGAGRDLRRAGRRRGEGLDLCDLCQR